MSDLINLSSIKLSTQEFWKLNVTLAKKIECHFWHLFWNGGSTKQLTTKQVDVTLYR